jgi:DNA replication licensing factor MCM4
MQSPPGTPPTPASGTPTSQRSRQQRPRDHRHDHRRGPRSDDSGSDAEDRHGGRVLGDPVAVAPGTPDSRHTAGSVQGGRGRAYDDAMRHSDAPGTPSSVGTRVSQRSGWSQSSRHQVQFQQHQRRRAGGDDDDDAQGGDDARAALPTHHGGHGGVGDDLDIDNIGQAVIWGTDVSVDDVVTRFKRFITVFTLPDAAGSRLDAEPYYMQKLDEIILTNTLNLNIDCQHLRDFGYTRRLYSQLLQYPQEIIPLMDLVVNQEKKERRQVCWVPVCI